MRLFTLSASLAISSGLAATACTASAAESDGARNAFVEEVLVTARKREERLQDLPGSAAALTEAMIEDVGGINGMRDITDLIPGITLVEAASPDLMEPSIRGAGQSRNRSSVSATGFYRNGAYFASQSLGGRNFSRFDSFDVQQVEVLRGPQGALYGRNALGGAINIISHRPEDQFDIIATARAGEKDRFGVETILNLPVTDQFAVRVSYVDEEQDDGFFEDQNGDPVDDYDYEHSRVGLLYRPTAAMEVYYSFDYAEENYEAGLSQRRRPTTTDPYDLLINTKHDGEYDTYNHGLAIDYDLPKGTLTSVTNYRDRDVHRWGDDDWNVPNETAARNSVRVTQTFVDAEVFFQDVRYASNLTGPFQFLLGADYYTVTTRELIDDFRAGAPTIASSAIRDWEVDQDSWALYGSVDYEFENLPLSLSGELRYARDEVDGSVLTLTPNVSSVPILDFAGDNDFTNYPWTVSAAWRFEQLPEAIDSALAYVKVGSSYRHGGLNLGAGLPSDAFPTVPVYDEEDSISYELGLKSAWMDGRLKANAAAYFVVYDNFLDTTTNGCPQLCTYLDPVTLAPLGFDADGNRIETVPGGAPGLESPAAFFIDNVGEVEAWGLEVETSFTQPINNRGGVITANLGWSRQMGEVTEIDDDVSPAVADQLGAELNFVRPQQFKGTLIFRQPLPIDALGAPRLFAVATYIHEHGGVRGLDANPISLDGVDRLDARIGLEGDRWQATLNGSNVLDKTYDLDRTAVLFRLNDPEYYWFEFEWRLR